MTQNAANNLSRYYQRLFEEIGPQGWWPAETRLEIILGAILTQNTTWRNAAMAIARLREARLLNLRRLRGEPEARLQALIRPAGFFRQKARTIRAFIDWLEANHGGSLRRMFARPPGELRSALLGVKGLGPETVDAILLYAGRKALVRRRRLFATHSGASWIAGGRQHVRRSTGVHPSPPRTGSGGVQRVSRASGGNWKAILPKGRAEM